MPKKINVAIIGLGFGAEFIPIYQAHPDANLVAVCQRDPQKLKSIQEAFEISKGYTDYDELLRDPNVDAVHINSPIPDHAAQSIAALKAGKHVACTVPMGVSIDECRQIVELLPVPAADGVHLGVGVVLVDRDELRAETEADDRHTDLVRHCFAPCLDGVWVGLHGPGAGLSNPRFVRGRDALPLKDSPSRASS